MALDVPTRSFADSTAIERHTGFLAASLFSAIYVATPLMLMGSIVSVACRPRWWVSWAALTPALASLALPSALVEMLSPTILGLWPFRCVPKYFRYEEYHEITDTEMRASGKNYILGAHPHGVFTFVGVCYAIVTANAEDGFHRQLCKEVPTAAATVIKVFPILKDVLGIFGTMDASGKTLSKRLGRPPAAGRTASVILYVGGMLELFFSNPQTEVVFLTGRKGFIKLALREGADVIPIYMFGNTTVLYALTWGPLAALSRKLGVSVTFFWGRFGLPVPSPVKLVYARGRPVGLPHIPNPTAEDVDKWHAVYCEKLKQLFDTYKGKNPDYKDKQLIIK
mmetsp:Transcript_82628/g.164077  ORF Transcript_82628/g.164077 Transcript_82628/m.164077 type:complete len:338 (-) Transcript_82628:214-1227(-)